MRVKFSENFRWKPTPGVVIRYSAGMEKSVTRICGAKAIAAGKAVSVGGTYRGKGSKNSKPSEAGKEVEPTSEGNQKTHS